MSVQVAPFLLYRALPDERNGAMTGPLEIVGDDAGPVCEDGVCEIPGAATDPDD